MIIHKHKYNSQKSRALNRGIEWLLTYETWLQWWNDSGHIHERGRRKGQWVMARFNDKGPYSLDNIKCITQSENHADAPQRLRAIQQSKTQGMGHWRHTYTCPHCMKTGNGNTMLRHHFTNCKQAKYPSNRGIQSVRPEARTG